tara:strand:+ start:5584 stop:6345 length:762 start_codon:yes stop_codon:yes gene_type:complete
MGSKNSTSSTGGSGSSSSGGGRGSDRSGRQETNRRRNEVNPNVVKAGAKKVKQAIKKSGSTMYGDLASQTTNEYLVSIGEAKRGNPYYNNKGKITGYSYNLTAKGHKMKYGTYNAGGPQNPTGMGTVGKGGIMNQVPISEEMFKSQKRTQMIATGAMAALGVPVMGAAFADYNSKKYSDYKKSFEANFDTRNANTYSASNEQSSTESANLGFGDTKEVASNNSKKKSKTTKSTTKFFTGTGKAESSNKRAFYV